MDPQSHRAQAEDRGQLQEHAISGHKVVSGWGACLRGQEEINREYKYPSSL